ncbi:LAQU0S02e04170g1_1 [Lachancea quebecensis]|uniref:Large ribosomal subunit protein bL27m n=1 Tax=Lachancea quebecensis TaxID=1654605 RepID=A0A0P1KMS0_9SACH|nr:LAQU0S02e04170g1_1 [Lachancea quebecensis]
MTVWSSIIGLRPRPFGSPISSVLIHVRSATKKAAGSRTSMKDSAGRSLGPKKHEGQEVRPGEILMRQRGTKFFPGENVGIGKDHTIFALEPGYTRYYLDPFHPKRRFIGVALHPSLKLPTPHFEPRVRRFGRQVIANPEAAKKEESSLSRQQFLAKDSLMKNMKERELRRGALRVDYAKFLTEQLQLNFEGEQMDFATLYLLRIRSCIKNGYSLQDAQYNAKHFLEQEIILKAKREARETSALQLEMEHLDKITSKVDVSTSFNNRLELTRYISETERSEKKAKLIEDLANTTPMTRKDKKKIERMFTDAADYLSRSEEVRLRRKFLKPIKPEIDGLGHSDEKKAISTKRFNYEKRSTEVISRPKAAFLSKL